MIHLIGNYYMKSDRLSYIVGKRREGLGRPSELTEPRYYTTLARAVAETAEIVLRDEIASNEVVTLKAAVEELRRIKDKILNNLEDQKGA